MAIKDEVKDFVSSAFGEYSAAKIDEFAEEINPDANPIAFLDKCVDFLSTILGADAAKSRLQPFYDKYQ